MDLDWLVCNWKRLGGVVQEKWGKFTHLDLVDVAGERKRLIGLLQKRYGYSLLRAEAELDEFTRVQKARVDAKIEQCSRAPEP